MPVVFRTPIKRYQVARLSIDYIKSLFDEFSHARRNNEVDVIYLGSQCTLIHNQSGTVAVSDKSSDPSVNYYNGMVMLTEALTKVYNDERRRQKTSDEYR